MELEMYYWKRFIAHTILDYSLCNQNKSACYSTVELNAALFYCNIVGNPSMDHLYIQKYIEYLSL